MSLSWCWRRRILIGNKTHFRLSSSSDPESDVSHDIYHVPGAGRTLGLAVLLDPEVNETLALGKSFYGVEVFVHDPEEFPQTNGPSAIAQPASLTTVSVVPKVITSRATLRTVPVDERQCYFPDEIKLRATRKYSLISCLAECRVDFIASRCNCVPFFYLNVTDIRKKYRPCSLADVTCLKKYKGGAVLAGESSNQPN